MISLAAYVCVFEAVCVCLCACLFGYVCVWGITCVAHVKIFTLDTLLTPSPKPKLGVD